jgi:tRNA-dihydrouridine synthase
LSKKENQAGVNKPVLLFAPFKGLTNKAFRNAFARHFGGFDAMYAPFISGLGQDRIHPGKLTDFIPANENLAPTIPQVLSTDPREIILLGKTLEQQGFDHLNWNLGCPFSRIANKKRGCGILPYPEELDGMLGEIFREIPIKLSIKTRLGYYNPREIFKVLEVLEHYPIELLLIHARIGTQIYSGEADLEGFEKCLQSTYLPLAYNGDIIHKARFLEMQHRFPKISSWMIGRGALINPFLPSEIRGICYKDSEKRLRLLEFHQELLAEGWLSKPSEARLLGSVKSVWYYMAGLFSEPAKVFSPIKTSGNLNEYLQALEHALQQPFALDHEVESYFRLGIKHLGDPGD